MQREGCAISSQSVNGYYRVFPRSYAPSVLCKLFWVRFVVDSIPSALAIQAQDDNYFEAVRVCHTWYSWRNTAVKGG